MLCVAVKVALITRETDTEELRATVALPTEGDELLDGVVDIVADAVSESETVAEGDIGSLSDGIFADRVTVRDQLREDALVKETPTDGVTLLLANVLEEIDTLGLEELVTDMVDVPSEVVRVAVGQSVADNVRDVESDSNDERLTLCALTVRADVSVTTAVTVPICTVKLALVDGTEDIDNEALNDSHVGIAVDDIEPE